MRRVPTFLSIAFLLGAPAITFASDDSAKLALDAKVLLDTYFGDRQNLEQASALLTKALAADDKDPDVFVQAARLTIKGGHVVYSQYQPGAVDAYEELIDRAIKLDSKHTKAHILRAEAFSLRKNYTAQKEALDRARELGSKDPWLSIGYANYCTNIKDSCEFNHLRNVQALGPGTTADSRNAYVASLKSLARYKPQPGVVPDLKSIAESARKERNPSDAWTLGTFADRFIFRGMFDDAIAYSREALAVMDYGAGRLTLAAALYGKAAERQAAGDLEAADPLIREAMALNFAKADVLDRLSDSSSSVERLMPILKKIVE